VVTRAEGSDGPLSRELRGLGLQVLSWPAVRAGIADLTALRRALAAIESFGWIVFASRQAVTAQVLRQRGWPVDLTPDEASAAALVAAFAAQWTPGDAGTKILYPASSRALPTIALGLSQLGAQVTQVEAYRTEAATLDLSECRAWIARGAIAAVTFASPSAVTELAGALGAQDFQRLLSAAAAVAIGRTTARELSARGINAIVAESATLRGLALTTFRSLQARP
jgi:uroporphyrinogen-III synthase